MINTSKLKGIMAEKGITGQDLSKKLSITPKTFYTKMKKGVFGSDDIQIMINVLNIDNPMEIFFAQK